MDFIDQIDGVVSLLTNTLEGEDCCGLKHSDYDPNENHPAANFLCQNFGNMEMKVPVERIRIPICSECEEALSGKEWVLLYCLNCNESQWVNRRLAKRTYSKDNVVWMKACPVCYNEGKDSKVNS